VVEATREVVREELLSGAELAVGSRNNRRRLPPVGHSLRMTMTGELRLPGSLASTAGRFLVQEGHGDRALLLVRSDNSEVARQWLVMAGKAVVDAEQSSKERRSNGGRGSEIGGGLLW
jgi:hypothetical protein